MGNLKDRIKNEIKKEFEKECGPSLENTKQAYKKAKEEIKEDFIANLNNIVKDSNLEQKMFSHIVAKGEFEKYISVEHKYEYNLITSKDTFIIKNCENVETYKVEGNVWFGTHRLNILKGEDIIGTMYRKWYVLPRIEEEHFSIKRTEIQCQENRNIMLESFFDLETRKYKININNWKIAYKKKENYYSILSNTKEVAHIYKPSERIWIVGFNASEGDLDVALVTVALWNMFRK